MKQTQQLTSTIITAIALAVAAGPAGFAAVWDGGGDGISWNDAANWDASGVPDTTGETATFNNTDVGT